MGLNFITANPATKAFRDGQEADQSQRLSDLRIDQGQADLAFSQEQRQNARAADDATRSYLRTVGQGGPAPVTSAPAMASPAAIVAQTQPAAMPATGLRGAGRSFEDRLVGAEWSPNGPDKNPNSSAKGPGQFIDGTWLHLMRTYGPTEVDQMTDQQVLALRDAGTPEQRLALHKRMTDAYRSENTNALSNAGLPVSDGTLYLAHFAGPEGAKALLSADPNTPVERLLAPKAIASNPFLAGKTAGQVVAWAEGRMGGDAAADSQPTTVTSPATAAPPAAAMGQATATGLRSTSLQRGLAGALAAVPGAGGKAAEMMLAAATNDEKMALQGLQLAKTDPQAAIAFFTQMGDPPPPQFAAHLQNRAAVEDEIRQVELKIKQRTANQPYPKQPDPTLKEIIDPSGKRIYVPASQAVGQQVPPPQSGAPVKTFDPATGQTIYRQPADAYGMQAPPEKGMHITSDGKGGFSILEGPGAGSGELAKPTVNEIQKELTNNLSRLDRLNIIKQSFRPEFLTLPVQAGMAWTNFKDRIGVGLPPDQAKALTDFEGFRSSAFNELNQTLRAMSGAAVTPQESERLLAAIGDPSQDGPTKFQAKVDQTIAAVRMANARLNYIASNGLDPKNFGGIGLDTIPSIIDRRGAELEASIRQANPQADPASIQAEVIKGLRKEFGI